MKSGYSASDYKRLETRMNTYAALAVERLKLLQAAEAKLKVREAAFVASEQDVAKWADRAKAAEARVKEHEATIERLTEIQEAAVIDEAQLAWAKARVKVLEEALRRIASKTTDPYADSEALNALSAKEKP